VGLPQPIGWSTQSALKAFGTKKELCTRAHQETIRQSRRGQEPLVLVGFLFFGLAHLLTMVVGPFPFVQRDLQIYQE